MILLIIAPGSQGQDSLNQKKWFAGYELFEMSTNKLQNFAQEVRYVPNKKNQFRLVIIEVNLSERHLASSLEAVGVDGHNVNGYLRAFILCYDRLFGSRKNFYNF